MEITEFLLARIAEDEATARTAGQYGPSWSWQQGYGEMCNDPECPFGELLAEGAEDSPTVIMEVHGYDVNEGWEGAAHIARHDPARVLAECAAKRKVIAAHTVAVQLWWDEQCEIEVCDACQADSYPDQWPCPTICALAAVYAAHPDYRREWGL